MVPAGEEFADRFRAIPSKASQAMSKLKQIERLELIEKPIASTSREAQELVEEADQLVKG